MRTLIISICLFMATGIAAQNPEPLQIECSHLWQKNTLGSFIGSMGMYMDDYNGNGRDEMLLGNDHFFNVLEYTPENNTYEIIWGSKEHTDLHRLILADADNDNNDEILVYYNNHHIDLYDLSTLELKDSYVTEVEFWSDYDNIIVGDADNDGLNELVLIQNDVTSFYRITNGTCSKVMEMAEEGTDVRCGDIDGDGLNELVYNSGNVYRMEDGQPALIWTIAYPDYYTFIELADIDNDTIKEIFIKDNSLKVFDGDTRLLKWQKYNVDVEGFTVADTDTLGFPEIIYMENDWGDVFCLDALNGAQRWTIDKEEYGAANVVVGDPDGDGNLEVVYGSEGYSFAEVDHLHIVQIADLTEEYVSVHEKGLYTIIRIADIDNDSRNELITISKSSEIFGPGIISVYDAETKQLEWRSNDTFLPIDNSHGMKTMETADVDYDGDLEIVIPCSIDGDPSLIYINGRTHEIDTVRTFYTDAYEASPYDMVIDDINNDEILDIITVTQDSLWIINSKTLQRTKFITDYRADYFDTPVTGNVDNDPNIELVYVKGKVFIMDGVTEELVEVDAWGTFTNCFLYDYNHDGISDIIASNQQSVIFWINGITLQATEITDTGIPVYDLQFVDLNGDSEPEMIYTIDNKLYIRNLDGSSVYSQLPVNPLVTEITDYNNDGHIEIFFGTNYYVQQWDAGCYTCENLTAGHEIHPTSCANSNGSATVFPAGGLEPYTYLWNTGNTTPTINGMAAGIYNVSVTDNKGCTISVDVVIGLIEFIVESVVTTPDVKSTTDCEGSAAFHTFGGTPPYAILVDEQWTNLADSTIADLCEGNHQVTLKDANGCITTTNFVIESILGYPEIDASLQFNILPNPASGSAWLQTTQAIKRGTFASISTIQGITLKSIEITSQRTWFDLSQVPKGIYLLTLTNPAGKHTKKLVVQ